VDESQVALPRGVVDLGQGEEYRGDDVSVGAAEGGERLAKDLDALAMRCEELSGDGRVAACRELEHHREVVGQFAVLDLPARGAVRLDEAHERHPALAGVARRIVGQVRAALALLVEDRGEVRLERTLVEGGCRLEERAELGGDCLGEGLDRRHDLLELGTSAGLRVVEEDRCRHVHDPALRLRQCRGR
jgi:hypothetical protein